MTENPEASVLTARRAPQHVRLFSADDAYEHLSILTLLPSLAPLHLMLADTPWPHGFGATLTNVGPLSEGFERSVASPLQPRRLRAMGRTVRSISSLSDNHSNSFQVAVRFARHTTPIRKVPFESRPPMFRWHLLRVLLLTGRVAGWHDSAARRKAIEARSLGTSRSLLRCQALRLSATHGH